MGVFIGRSRLAGAEQQPAQMDGEDFSPPPGAGDGIVDRRGTIGGDGKRGR
jgi:hypothetical protein